MLPFPPRVFAKDYLALNPLGTIPFMIDGETKMTESSGICHYLGTRLWTDAADCRPRRAGLWRVPELDVFQRRHADLSANAGAALQPARAGGAAQSASRRRLCQMVLGPAAGCRSRDRQGRDARAGRFTAADIAIGYALRLAENIGLAKDFGPNVAAYWQRLQARDGYQRAVAAEKLAGESRRSRGGPEAFFRAQSAESRIFSGYLSVGDIRRDFCILADSSVQRARTQGRKKQSIAPGRGRT